MPNQYRMESSGRKFHQAILTSLKGKSVAPVDVCMDLGVQRFLFREKRVVSKRRGYQICHETDFCRFVTLPQSWWHSLDANGQGTTIDLLKMKAVLSWTPKHFVKKKKKIEKLLKGPRAPIEKLKIHFAKRA